MGGYYTVVQGDHLSKIAKENGFPDYHIIWDHPNNADLKNQRKNPNVLHPGDQVFVPDKEQKHESGSTKKRHTFVVNKEPLKLRLVLEDSNKKPIANAQYALLVEGEVTQHTTDSRGRIEQEIPQDAQEATLVLRGEGIPFRDVPISIKIGHLDPVEEVSGQVARLNNLGYSAGDGGEDDEGFESAVKAFQRDHGLTVDGICGPLTQAKLKKVHGC
jgi:murein L,D-transpeptidase YcbB/YkuD